MKGRGCVSFAALILLARIRSITVKQNNSIALMLYRYFVLEPVKMHAMPTIMGNVIASRKAKSGSRIGLM